MARWAIVCVAVLRDNNEAVRVFFKKKIASFEATARDLKNRGYNLDADKHIETGAVIRDILGEWSRITRGEDDGNEEQSG
jgi:hypothetical protein